MAGDALSTWTFGSRVTLVGDAAHAHGGAFATGGSLALDDAFALGLAFRYVAESLSAPFHFSIDHIKRVLKLFSNTRKPHTDRLMSIVNTQLSNKALQLTDTEDEESILLSRIKNRPNTEWLYEHDVEAAFAAAVEQLEMRQSAEDTSPLQLLGKPDG